MNKVFLLMCALSVSVEASATFDSGGIGLSTPHPVHGAFKHLRHPAQCPGHCYNYHANEKQHASEEVRDAHIAECVTVCRKVKEIDQGVGQFNPPGPRGR